MNSKINTCKNISKLRISKFSKSSKIGLVIILVSLTILVRSIGLTKESVWWDEYTSLMHIGVGSLKEFLYLNPMFDPATLPVYYTLEYLFWHYVSPTVLGLRIFSIAISIATVMLILWLGTKYASFNVGLFAGILFAISSIHRFHAQGIRMYVLFAFLAILSVSFVVGWFLEYKKIYLFFLLITNFLLLWTHPFAFFIVFIELAWILIFVKKRVIERGALITIHLVFFISIFGYLYSVEYYSPESAHWIKIPNLIEFLFDLLADDAINFTYQVKVCEFVPKYLRRISTFFDILLLMVSFSFLCLLLLFQFTEEKKDKEWYINWLLLSIWIIPPSLLYVMSWLWRPCIFPRYTVYSSIMFYLIFGNSLRFLRKKSLFIPIVLIIPIIFLYQLLITISCPQRTNWQECAQLIKNSSTTVDSDKDHVILVFQGIYKDVFLFNMNSDFRIPVAFVEDKDILFFVISVLFSSDQCKKDVIWFIHPSFYFQPIGDIQLENKMREMGLIFEQYDFEGIEPIRVYKIENSRLISCDNLKEEQSDLIYLTFVDLVLSYAENGLYDCAQNLLKIIIKNDPLRKIYFGELLNALENNRRSEIEKHVSSLRNYQMSQKNISKKYKELFLSKAFTNNPNLEIAHFCFDAIETSIQGDIELAKRKFLDIAKQYPQLALPRIGLGNLALTEGDEDEAKKWLYSVLNIEEGAYGVWRKLFDYMFIEKNYQLALKEYYRLKKENFYVEPFWEEYLRNKIN